MTRLNLVIHSQLQYCRVNNAISNSKTVKVHFPDHVLGQKPKLHLFISVCQM